MNILLGRQSIVDKNQQLFAYELLFRSIDKSPIQCDTEATASVLSNTLSMMSIDNVLGDKRGFVNIGIDILRQGLLDLLPPHRFVIEILETQKPSEELVQFIHEFKKKDYIFALDDMVLSEENLKYWEPVLHAVQIVKVDVVDTNIEDLQKKTNQLRTFNVALLAEKVETIEMFDICHQLGYEYYQGYFFTKPVILKSPNLSPTIQAIMHVIQVLQENSDVDKVEETIRLYPELIISLLKIVNSASIATVKEITSIRQAIVLLGNRPLSQWLLLLLYSQKNLQQDATLKNDPLFLIAIQRAKSMELLIKAHDSNISRSLVDEAFLVGILSLSDVLLHTPLKDILKELNVGSTIFNALLKQEGLLGDLLYMIKILELGDLDLISKLSTELNISIDTINKISVSALQFSNTLANTF